jgi:hypothetical protein
MEVSLNEGRKKDTEYHNSKKKKKKGRGQTVCTLSKFDQLQLIVIYIQRQYSIQFFGLK